MYETIVKSKKTLCFCLILSFLLVSSSVASSLLNASMKFLTRTKCCSSGGDVYNTPTFHVNDKWVYEMKFNYESSVLKATGKIKDYTVLVESVENSRYKTKITGNFSGSAGIFGLIPVGSASGSVSGYAYVNKKDIAYVQFLLNSKGKISGGAFSFDIDATLDLNPPWVYIDFPVEVGDEWRSFSKANLSMHYKIKTVLDVTLKEGDYKKSFVLNNILRCKKDHVKISTKAGTFNDALFIENETDSRIIIKIWFSPSVGNMVKWVYKDISSSDKIEFSMELTSFEYKYNTPPYTPKNPSPQNDEKDVDINTSLSCDGGDPDKEDVVTYEIYLGENQNPPKIGSISKPSTQNRITFELDKKLDYNTDYYWRVVAKDSKGSESKGPLWHFTTKGNNSNNPPYKPSNPSPSNGETDINVSKPIVLSWDGGDPDENDTVTYDIYLDKKSNPSTKVHTLSKPAAEKRISFELDINLENATKYYWKVVSTDDKGASREGPIWDFATEGYIPENRPPFKPSNPTPADKKEGVDVNPTLSWYGGDPDEDDTVRYDIYLGTSEDSLQKKDSIYKPATLHQISYNLENLWEKTWYYWRIVATDDHGETVKGPIWSFKTKVVDTDPPSVWIQKPVEGGIYINDKLRFTDGFISIYLHHSLIIGPITIEVVAADDVDGGIARVQIFIDEELRYEDSAPYGSHKWLWDDVYSFSDNHWHVIKAVAYDTSGNMGFAEMKVRKIL